MKNKKKIVAKSKKRKSKAKPTLMRSVRTNINRITENVMDLFKSQPTDLISAIVQDHDGLRQYIAALKDTKRDMTERRRAYELFSSLLKSHTIAEEEAVYKPIEKNAKSNLVIRIEEGYVEHHVTTDIMTRMEKATDHMVWSAHANVLAEIIEHHLDEEEEKMFPLMRKQISKKLEADLIIQYLDLRASTQIKATSKNSGVLQTLQA
jgi:hemerythrin-like domain-containing protein